jgi:uncharacterized membrane protein YeiH
MIRKTDAAEKPHPSRLLLTLDLLGTFVFALEGALAAVEGDLDLLGLMVLSFATALGGGIIRDVLIGAIPPGSIRDWRLGSVAFLGASIVFLFHHFVQQIPNPLILSLDAVGLALFAVSGAGKALAYDIHPFIAVLMGGITGVGGGTVRDVLLAQVPTVLRSDVYATAALAGAAVMVIGVRMKLPKTLAAVAGAIVCFMVRILSVWRHWNLPHVHVQ